MNKTLVFFIIVAAAMMAAGPRAEARAFGYGIKNGYCAIGTCAKNGGTRARNVKNCSALNCQRPQAPRR